MKNSRTIIIGDVHGCVQEAESLLGACKFEAGDSLIFTGDLIGRGPDSKAVLELAKRLNASSVRGNHEHALLGWKEALDRGTPPPYLPDAHRELALSLEESDWSFIRTMPLFLTLPEHNAIVVHAGLVPGVPLEEQSTEILLSIRTLRRDGSGSSGHDDGPPWATMWLGPQEIVFGHNARRGLQKHKFATGLDTGCVYGGSLTAYILPERRLVSVPALKVHRKPREADW